MGVGVYVTSLRQGISTGTAGGAGRRQETMPCFSAGWDRIGVPDREARSFSVQRS